MEPNQDVKETDPSTSPEGIKDGDHQKAGSGSDIPDGGKPGDTPKDIPYARFKEVIDKNTSLEKVVTFFRQYIQTPDDLVAFKEWQKKATEKAKDEEADGEISAEQLAKFRKAMKLANPELEELVERMRRQEEAKYDSQFDTAEDQIRELCKKTGFPEDEQAVARVAVHIMDEIRSDEKLLRQWQAGNLRCVDAAFKNYLDFLYKMGRPQKERKETDLLAERRRIMRTPALPSGKAGGPATPSEKRSPEDKGITKKTHEDAWEVFQSHMNE